jgi:hypothetical protein
MGVTASDLLFYKPVTVTDTAANGGRKGQVQVVEGARHNLLPRVTAAERAAGVTRRRKEFLCNRNVDDDILAGVLVYMAAPTVAGDRLRIAAGTQDDTAGDITATSHRFTGAGKLNSALSGSETAVDLLMPGDDYEFFDYLHLSNHFKASQTIAADVGIGDSVELVSGTWEKIAVTSDITYPNGIYLGNDTVWTEDSGTEEFLELDPGTVTDEDIGTGDGSSTAPTLSNLADAARGMVTADGLRPVITTVDTGDNPMEVVVAADGTCSGDCTAGELDMDDGTWTTDITWTAAPKNGSDILASYTQKCWTYSGNVATVHLKSGVQVANAYTTAITYGGGCLYLDELTPTSSDWAESSGSGTYDESANPLTLYNDGTERDTITLTMTSATAFTAAGVNAGSLGTGSISADFTPTNPDTGQPFFSLASAGWGGTWTTNDTITFKTNPAALPVWVEQIVPAACAAGRSLPNLGVYGDPA